MWINLLYGSQGTLTPDDIAAVESNLGIKAVNSLGKYLSYPLGIGSKVRDFKDMKDRFLQNLRCGNLNIFLLVS